MKLTRLSDAPDFTLPDQNGTMHSLSQYKGKWVLIYFYPKDDTAGCTAEACGLRDNMPQFKKLNCVVLGISFDTVKSHKKFVDKFTLPFTLLSDEDKKVIKLYDVWQEKEFICRKYMGTVRT